MLPVVVLFSRSYPPSHGRLEFANPRLFSVISLSAAVSSILSLNVSYRNTEDAHAGVCNSSACSLGSLFVFSVSAAEPVLWAVQESREKPDPPLRVSLSSAFCLKILF